MEDGSILILLLCRLYYKFYADCQNIRLHHVLIQTLEAKLEPLTQLNYRMNCSCSTGL